MKPNVEELLVQYIKKNPEKTYREIAAWLKVSDRTISRIAIKNGLRKIRPALTVADVAKLTEASHD